jgi:murein DD-endopeptidase MepM/ murein hydrolase activator NlpD
MRWLIVVAAVWWSAVTPPCGTPPGEVVREFAPVGAYAGHWGVDFATGQGSEVVAAADGVVTFAGSVAGVRTVTVLHEGSLRASYSYLDEIAVAVGDSVRAGDVLGRSGVDHGVGAVHVSARVGGVYVDPMFMFSCERGTIRLSPLNG